MWSLGIILVNLTCGRNPWKRASMDDSTFRAYRNNPRFLSSILPLSPELDYILGRIFEHDPRKRIRIPELRNLILNCNHFTARSSGGLPPTPPCEPQYSPGPEIISSTSTRSLGGFDRHLSSERVAAPSFAARPIMTQFSTSSRGSDHGSIFSTTSSCSSISSCASDQNDLEVPEAVTSRLSQQTRPMYSCSFAFSKPSMVQACTPSVTAN